MKYHRHKQSIKKPLNQEKKSSDNHLGKEHVKCHALSTDANGVARLEDGTIVFVEGLLPDEQAHIKIWAKKSTYKRASIIHLENMSSLRLEPPCVYFEKCGGCQLQHIKPESQIDFKLQWFFETLKRIGKWKAEYLKLAEKNFSIVYLNTDHYRRRIRLHFDGKNLGYYEKDSHNIINIDSCYIARSALNEKIKPLKNQLEIIYPEIIKNFEVNLKLEFDIELTESDNEKVLTHFVNFKGSVQLNENQNIKIRQILQKHFQVQEEQLIQIKHPYFGKFKLKKESFIQPHFAAIDTYYDHILNCVHLFLLTFRKTHLNENTLIQAWDLYAGCGIFSCIPHVCGTNLNIKTQTLAVEGVQESIDSLNLNYKNLPIEGETHDVHEFIEHQFSLLSEENRAKTNIVILDPPRSGVGIPIMQKLVELCAHESCVLYLACDPASFARDTQILIEGGYTHKQIFLFDSFGQTNFYEVLGFFTRGILV